MIEEIFPTDACGRIQLVNAIRQGAYDWRLILTVAFIAGVAFGLGLGAVINDWITSDVNANLAK